MAISGLHRAALVACVALRLGVGVDGQPDGAGVIVRMGAYVDAWEIELGSVVANESYRQAVTRLPRSGVVREPGKPAQETRNLTSEFTLIHFDEGASDWIGYRAVKTVDGRIMTEAGPTLNQLLSDARLSWPERWAQVRDRSAAFNLGSIARDINLPTFALAVLRTVNRPRFRFATPRTETIDGEVLLRIDFREHGRPTLVSGFGGRDIPLQGSVWLDQREGRVRRTEILLRDRIIATPGGTAEEERKRDEELASRINVVFGPDAGVGTWVPIEMRERYDNAWGDVTTGHAAYADYRRFRTAGRLIRPE